MEAPHKAAFRDTLVHDQKQRRLIHPRKRS